MVEIDEETNLTTFVVDNAENRPQQAGFARKVNGQWQDVTNKQFLQEVSQLAKGFIAAGIAPGDRICLMSQTRYEWTLADYAIWFAGAITVPIYETSSAEQVQWILSDSGCSAVIAETSTHTDTIQSVIAECPTVKHVWTIDNDDLTSVAKSGEDISDDDLETARSTARLDDLATIIYTSGTTGRPKGCELTHGNFAFASENSALRLERVLTPDANGEPPSTLLFLPLAHVFARYIQTMCVVGGTKLAHTGDVKAVVDDLGAYRPTYILSVPRVFEKVYNSAEQKAKAGGKGKIFSKAAETSIEYSKALAAGHVPVTLRAKHFVFDKLVYSKLRDALGGRAQYAMSGGAPLGPRLGHFFRGIGLTILEGYGLTETTAPTASNMPDELEIGSVGTPMPGMSVKIAEDSEVLVKGPHVFRGYWNNKQATDDAFVDGWFRTGDLGELNDQGHLRITGRKKEILITAAGKNVVPAQLEDIVRAHPLVSQAMVVGDGERFISVLITLDDEMLPTWLSNESLPEMSVAEAANHETVRNAIQEAIDKANDSVSRAESIRVFRILDVDFTEEGGHLTPSMKLKRRQVMADFGDIVDEIYADQKTQ